jgi:hypothetical protein
MTRLSHNFIVGINNVTISKIERWRYKKVLNHIIDDVNLFVQFLNDYDIEIISYDVAWIKVNIKDENDLSRFYQKCIEF